MVSTVGFAWAAKEVSAGTVHAVWVGIRLTLAMAHGMIFDGESISRIKTRLSLEPVGCIKGLEAVS
jgi:multidrug transporter EmrE-like cation transporter